MRLSQVQALLRAESDSNFGFIATGQPRSVLSTNGTRCRRDFVIFIVPPHRGPPVKLTKKVKIRPDLHFTFPWSSQSNSPSVSITTERIQQNPFMKCCKESRLNFPISGNLDHLQFSILMSYSHTNSEGEILQRNEQHKFSAKQELFVHSSSKSLIIELLNYIVQPSSS